MLPDSFFKWDHDEGNGDLMPAITVMQATFQKFRWPSCANPQVFGSLIEFTALMCRTWGISERWVLVSAQREQSCFQGETPVYDDSQLPAQRAWLGFVGQDKGRVVRPAYYGMFPQVARLVEQSAWLFGQIPSDCWRESERAHKGTRRYSSASMLRLYDDPPVDHRPATAGEYLQLSYTPHALTPALNESIAKKLGLYS